MRFNWSPSPGCVLLHITRSGQINVYQTAHVGPPHPLKTFPSIAAMLAWLTPENELFRNKYRWRILHEGADPVTKRITLPPLAHGERQKFLQHALQAHASNTPCKAIQPIPNFPTSPDTLATLPQRIVDALRLGMSETALDALLVAIPENPSPDHALAPLIKALRQTGQGLDLLLSPGQVLASQETGTAVPRNGQLQLTRHPHGVLTTFIREGVFHFSRLLPEDTHPDNVLSRLLPTLQAHGLVNRQMPIQILPTNASYPEHFLEALAKLPVPALDLNRYLPGIKPTPPTTNLLPPLSLHQQITHWQPRFRAGMVILLASGLMAYQQTAQLRQAQEKHTPVTLPQPMTEQLEKALPYLTQARCPDLSVATEHLSHILREHPTLSLSKLRWRCLKGSATAHLTLTLVSPDSPTSPYPVIKSLQMALSSLGRIQRSARETQNNHHHFLIELEIASPRKHQDSARAL